jgi:hypothetical protein
MRRLALSFLVGSALLNASPTITWNFDDLTPQTGVTELYPNPALGCVFTTVGNVDIDGPGGPCRARNRGTASI